MSIRRRNHGKSHSYVDTDTGHKVLGVTTIRDNGVPKKALINWSAEATAEYAVDHWDELSDLAPSVRLKTLKKARYAVVDEAANRGTQVHKLAERLVNGETVTVPDGLEGYVASYVRFLDEFDVQPILVEKTVWSRAHGYCGTFDLIADLLDPDDPEPDPTLRRRVRWLLDIKTNRSGIFGETALQLAAYRYADCWIDEDDDAEMELPEVEATGAVHVRADDYDLIPVDAGPDQHRMFLYAQQIAEFCATSRELVGEPIDAPTTSTFRLTREEWQ
jgi:hypothetical protein